MRKLFVVLVAAMCLSLAGCETDESPSAVVEKPKNNLIGTWGALNNDNINYWYITFKNETEVRMWWTATKFDDSGVYTYTDSIITFHLHDLTAPWDTIENPFDREYLENFSMDYEFMDDDCNILSLFDTAIRDPINGTYAPCGDGLYYRQ